MTGEVDESPSELIGIPLFSLGERTRVDRIADKHGNFTLKLFEPKYRAMAKSIERGKRQFGFLHGDMKGGMPGWVVKVMLCLHLHYLLLFILVIRC